MSLESVCVREKRERERVINTTPYLSNVQHKIMYLCLSRFGPNTIPRLLGGIQLCLTCSGAPTLCNTKS